MLKPVVSLDSVNNFKGSIIGVPDQKCELPFGYLFLPIKNEWNGLFMDYVNNFMLDGNEEKEKLKETDKHEKEGDDSDSDSGVSSISDDEMVSTSDKHDEG